MSHSTKQTTCPECGSTELGKGRQTGMAVMYPFGKVSVGSDVESVVCTDCGFIIKSFVKKPEKFKGTMI